MLNGRTAHRRDPRVIIWFWGKGGAGIRLADRLAALGSELIAAENVTLCCHAGNSLLPIAVERGNSVVTVSGAAGHDQILELALQAPARALRFWSILRGRRPDALIIPMNFALAWPCVLIATSLRIPYALMVHDAAPHPGDFAPLWQMVTQRLLIRHAKCLIAPSAFTAQQLKKRFSPKAVIEILPLGSLARSRRASPRATPHLPIRFLFLGRLLPYKGLGLLAEALRPLIGVHGWQLTIAGAGPESNNVRRDFSGFPQVDLANLRALGEEEIDEMISSHDVLICPYTEASQSGVIAEAIADGMPCVVTPIGALPEQVGEGRFGWVTKGTESADVSNTLMGIIKQPAAISEKSEQTFQFGQECAAQNPLVAVFHQMLGPSTFAASVDHHQRATGG